MKCMVQKEKWDLFVFYEKGIRKQKALRIKSKDVTFHHYTCVCDFASLSKVLNCNYRKFHQW